MRCVAVLLALAASALAFQVTEPTASQGWTTSGPNTVAWSTVSTDASNFTIVLVNQSVNPPTTQVLAALVDAGLAKTTVNPPSGGWKSGKGFQVNLVKDSQDLSSILAQSAQFEITTSTSSTFSTGLTLTTTGASATTTVPSTATDTALNPTQTTTNQNGASSMSAQTGLIAGLAFLGAFLA
ncbi:Ser-Thr-rich glycosyl-phosphatidyl-inositol-anchored membrane family-domain-containing protein [Daedaleopsis nitida]|nr:Ser-Thr-rich glycosyl-phosphatidyl-inositol-anchored membrane family-domain-containing protein [Daedaleopsis nitida]